MAFAPQKLKIAFAKAAVIEMPALPDFRVIDMGSLLKFTVSFGMIVVLLFASILPQTQLFGDAGSAICGMHRVSPRIA